MDDQNELTPPPEPFDTAAEILKALAWAAAGLLVGLIFAWVAP